MKPLPKIGLKKFIKIKNYPVVPNATERKAEKCGNEALFARVLEMAYGRLQSTTPADYKNEKNDRPTRSFQFSENEKDRRFEKAYIFVVQVRV